MDSAINKYLSIPLSLLLSAIIFSTASAAGDCSPYLGFASFNEFFKDKTNQSNDADDFVEIKILDSSIAPATYSQWTIQLCENDASGNNNDDDGCSGEISLGNFVDMDIPWLILKDGTIGSYFNFKTGFDAILLDDNDDVIDYLSVDSHNALVESGCTGASLPYDYQASSPGASDKFIFRTPDGTGEWDSAESASETPTENGSNDTGLLPSLTFSDVIITQGTTTAEVTFELDSGSPDIITINFATFDDTLFAGSDYTSVNTTGAFAIGDTSLTLTVPVNSTSDLGDFNFLISIDTSTAGLAQIINHVGTVSVVGGSSIDHYAISHGGAGITCEPKTVTVTAHNADHSPHTVSSDIIVTVTTDPTVDAISNSSVTIVTGQSSTTFTLSVTSVTSAPHIDINVDDTNSTETSGSADATDDPALAFFDSQLQFVTDTNLPPGIAISAQIGGKPSSSAPNAQNLYLRAVRTDDTTGNPVCVAALDAGTHSVDMGYQCIDSNNCSANELGVSNNLTYNAGTATTIARNNGATTTNTLPVTLDFDTSGYAPLSYRYDNVGEVALFANAYTMLNGGVIGNGVSDSFIVRPFALVLDFDNGGSTYDMRQLDWVDGNLNGSSSNNSYSDPDPTASPSPQNSTVFQVAGTDFPVQIAGVLWQAADDSNNDGEPDTGANLHNNSVASLFGQESSRVIQITHSLEQPSPGNVGILTSNFPNPYASGRREGTMNWNEVGIIDIQVELNSYLADMTYIPAFIAQDVGRFRPANFRLQTGSVMDGNFMNSCGVFTYIGQDFNYDSNPAFIVEAVSSTLSVTSNYSGVWNKLTSASFPVSTVTSDSTNSLDIMHTQQTINYNPAGNGVFNVAFGDDSFCYGLDVLGACEKQANAQITPFSADMTMTLGMIDDGEVSTVINQAFSPVLADLRYGRLALDNVFGSELIPLQMPMYTEYFDGNNFVVNTADNCTTVDHNIVNELGVVAEAAVSSSVASVNPTTANMGVLNVDLTSPGANNTGSIDVTPDLDISAEPWLKYDWDASLASPGLENPTGLATFGIYKGNDVNIYIQQIYQ